MSFGCHIKRVILFCLLIIAIQKVGFGAITINNTAISSNDTLISDEDTTKSEPIEKSVLEHQVDYSATDSVQYNLSESMIYLFGDASIKYGSISLKAAYIEYRFKDNTVYATYARDSSGKVVGKPEFKDGKESFVSNHMTYNFKSRKGQIKKVITEQQGGYLGAKIVKKDSNDVLYMKNATYCPCEDSTAKTFFKISKVKLTEKKDIIAGPGYLSIAGIPTPLGFPFGFFPNKRKASKGIILPAPGDSPSQGFYFRGGGFYMPIGEKFDTKITGDIYTSGSWGLKNTTRYKARYKYSGKVDLSYNKVKTGDPELSSYKEKNNFFVRWSHTKDSKSNPTSRFSSNVNLGSANNFQTNLNRSSKDYLTNTFQSNISYSKSFKNNPFSFALNARHSQNSQSGNVNIKLPEFSLNMSRQYLGDLIGRKDVIKRNPIGQMGISYTALMSNDLTFNVNDSSIFHNDNVDVYDIDPWMRRMKNGMRHNVSASTSLKMFKGNVTINPSFNYTNRWYLQRIKKTWDNDLQQVVVDTIREFSTNGNFSTGASMTTKIFSFYSFSWGKISKIRHVMTPRIGFTYQKGNNTLEYGYYGDNGEFDSYSPFEGGIYQFSSGQDAGNINLSLNNNLEMKVRTPKDTVNDFKKVKLIESINFTTRYNLFADSLKLSVIQMSGFTKLFKKVSVRFSGSFDPYISDSLNRRHDQFTIKETGKLARFTTGNIAFNFNLNQIRDKKKNQKIDDDDFEDIDEYIDFSIPWNLSLGYRMSYRRSFINKIDTASIIQTVNFTGDVFLTQKWRIGIGSGFDFVNKRITYTSVNIFRDLGCWEMKFNWIPIGPSRSYNFQLNIKSPMLKDFKIKRRRMWTDYDN